MEVDNDGTIPVPYCQVCVDPASPEKTAFITYSELYEFKMPFGSNISETGGSSLARCTQDNVLVIG